MEETRMKSSISPNLDGLSVTLFIGVGALIVAIGCLAVVAWANAGSRNLALATATLFASGVLLAVQIPFELRSKSDTSLFSAEYTIDRLKPQIRQWSYPATVGWRLTSEVGASDALAKTDPNAFKSDGQKLTQDMTIRSLAIYLLAAQFDWQLREVQVRGPSTGTQTTTEALSKPAECSMVTSTQVEAMLAKAGNVFASGPTVRQQICLPPGSTLNIQDSSLSITTPFVRISFLVEATGGAFFGKPGTGGLESPSLPDGSPQFETRAHSVRATTEYSWIRAQHRDIELYQRWVERVVTGAQRWFEG
jgi:hypothetical protein